jgi:hypothetical protein
MDRTDSGWVYRELVSRLETQAIATVGWHRAGPAWILVADALSMTIFIYLRLITETLPNVYLKFMTSPGCQGYPHRLMKGWF